MSLLLHIQVSHFILNLSYTNGPIHPGTRRRYRSCKLLHDWPSKSQHLKPISAVLCALDDVGLAIFLHGNGLVSGNTEKSAGTARLGSWNRSSAWILGPCFLTIYWSRVHGVFQVAPTNSFRCVENYSFRWIWVNLRITPCRRPSCNNRGWRIQWILYS